MTSTLPDSRARSTSTTADHADRAILRMCDEIQPGRVITWLNHWSLHQADFETLRGMDAIGFDGTLLQLSLRARGHVVGRTSADLVLPHVLAALPYGSTVVLLGAAPGVGARAAERLRRPGLTVHAFNGYEALRRLRGNFQDLRDLNPDLVAVGLGAPLQDAVALELHDVLPNARICTAGGWIDQLAEAEQYFPAWIHRARLGWAWRIAHEPRRLTQRYTRDALMFRQVATQLIAQLDALGGHFTLHGLDRTVPCVTKWRQLAA